MRPIRLRKLRRPTLRMMTCWFQISSASSTFSRAEVKCPCQNNVNFSSTEGSDETIRSTHHSIIFSWERQCSRPVSNAPKPGKPGVWVSKSRSTAATSVIPTKESIWAVVPPTAARRSRCAALCRFSVIRNPRKPRSVPNRTHRPASVLLSYTLGAYVNQLEGLYYRHMTNVYNFVIFYCWASNNIPTHAPPPSRSSATVVPPCAAAISATIDRPRPEPGIVLVASTR